MLGFTLIEWFREPRKVLSQSTLGHLMQKKALLRMLLHLFSCLLFTHVTVFLPIHSCHSFSSYSLMSQFFLILTHVRVDVSLM